MQLTDLELETLRESVTEVLEGLSNMDEFEMLTQMEQTGYCAACGDSRGECEPDAQGYECWSCGGMKVIGFDTAVVMTQ